eukprot:gene15002-biopygen12210
MLLVSLFGDAVAEPLPVSTAAKVDSCDFLVLATRHPVGHPEVAARAEDSSLTDAHAAASECDQAKVIILHPSSTPRSSMIDDHRPGSAGGGNPRVELLSCSPRRWAPLWRQSVAARVPGFEMSHPTRLPI